MAMSLKEREAREKIVLKYIKDGMSMNEIARALGISPNSVSKFLRLRGLQTVHQQQAKGSDKDE